MPDEILVIQYGLGPIGRAVAQHAVEREGVTLVGGTTSQLTEPDFVAETCHLW